MFCPNCGAQTDDQSKFCDACGFNLAENAETPAADPIPDPFAPQTPADNTLNAPEAAPNPAETPAPEAAAAPVDPAAQPVADAAAATAAAPAAEGEQKKSNTGKVVAIAAAAVVGVGAVGGIGAKVISSLAGSSQNTYVYLSDGSYSIMPKLGDEKADKDIEIASSRSSEISGRLVQFSPDGKYLYYFTKFDGYSGYLNRVEYSKLKAGSSKNDERIESIGSNVRYNYIILDNGAVLYENDDENLYYYNGEEAVKVAKSVSEFNTDGKDRIVYTTGDYSDGYSLYALNVNEVDKGGDKIASNISDIYDWSDLDHIFYTKEDEDDDYNTVVTLYTVGFSTESEKVAADVTMLGSADGTVAYLVDKGEAVSLYDYVNDTYASADANITRPSYDDFEIVTDYYYKLSTYSDISGYDKIYCSCTQDNYWYYESLEEVLEDLSDTDEAKPLLSAFISKYKSTENSEGYFVVDETVKSELKQIATALGWTGDSVWQAFCFYTQSGTTTDYDAYYEAYDVYYEASDRIYLREQLQDEYYDASIYELYVYHDGSAELITDQLLSYERSYSGIGGILYNTADMPTEKVNIDEISSVYDVKSLLALNYSAENYLLSFDGKSKYQLSEKAAEDLADYIGASGSDDDDYDSYSYSSYNTPTFYFTGAGLFMTDGNRNLYSAVTADGKVNSFEDVEDDIYVLGVRDDVIYYAYDVFESGSKTYGDLYCYKDGSATLLAKEVMSDYYMDVYNPVRIFDDNTLLTYTDNTSRGSELSLYDADGKGTVIADEVSGYYRVDKNTILYISDDDLYMYDIKKGEKTKLRKDVDVLWVKEQMDATTVYASFN